MHHRIGDDDYVNAGWDAAALETHLLSIGWVAAGQTRTITAGMHQNFGDANGPHYTVDTSYHVYPVAHVVTDASQNVVHRW
jgi:hypothetical protein